MGTTMDQGGASLISFSDAISPEQLAAELTQRGLQVSADFLRDRALALGACHVLDGAMFLLPEDVDAILRSGKQAPSPSAAKKSGGKADKLAAKQLGKLKPANGAKAFTPAMVAERWGCSERHVRNLINEGKLNCFRLGGKLMRIRAVDVEAAEKLMEEEITSAEAPDGSGKKDPLQELTTRVALNALRATKFD